jgi:predicted  nucleic acid-binding Zn-ribbon protein
MMITRQVRCKNCGVMFPLTYPEKLSDIGRDVISYCPLCNRIEITKHKEDYRNEKKAENRLGLSGR